MSPFGVAMTLILFVALYPTLAPWASTLEGKLRPVVTDVEIVRTEATPDGLFVYVTFEKIIPCEFVSLNFYDPTGKQVRPDFDPNSDYPLAGITRPVGEAVAGPWLLPNVHTLEGGRFVAIHECHKLWHTTTQFWPQR
ncbi:MAG: hypothetical protein AAGF32_04555 [Pseudomonadota bacterium]